jgi:hypothetical protein
VPTTGTAITKILPKASRFLKENDHATKKQRVLEKLVEFFNRYVGSARRALPERGECVAPWRLQHLCRSMGA